MASRNISFEPCTLVYTLLNPKKLNFDDFSLIVRSLHSYMVESVTPNPEMQNIHVRLNYQASVQNAINKLGKLRNVICVSKLNVHIKEHEFARLEQLRQKYGLNAGFGDDSCQPRPKFPKFRRGGGPTFQPRAAPYPKKAATVTSSIVHTAPPEDSDEESLADAQEFPGAIQTPESFDEFAEHH